MQGAEKVVCYFVGFAGDAVGKMGELPVLQGNLPVKFPDWLRTSCTEQQDAASQQKGSTTGWVALPFFARIPQSRQARHVPPSEHRRKNWPAPLKVPQRNFGGENWRYPSHLGDRLLRLGLGDGPEVTMKTDFKFSNLLGTVYCQGNLLFSPDGTHLYSPVGNRVSVFNLVE